MKKLISLFLLLALVLAFAGCGAPAQTPAEPSPAAAEEPVSESAEAAPSQEPDDVPEAEAEAPAAEEAPETATLVVYFSATGTTRSVAEQIAALTGAGLFEIVPAEPYTAEDLNYGDHSTRATVEQNDPDARPEIANEISLEGCTTLYLGYPIWWGDSPRILSTFVESHDFTGITVIPFCTSGSSGPGRTGEALGELAGTGTFLASTRLTRGMSDAELQEWIESRG
ncbi:MAG TPA: flavodoxin [Clostridiales bacterium]|nr:flavodoxin [Clostridiales bacterium]